MIFKASFFFLKKKISRQCLNTLHVIEGEKYLINMMK